MFFCFGKVSSVLNEGVICHPEWEERCNHCFIEIQVVEELLKVQEVTKEAKEKMLAKEMSPVEEAVNAELVIGSISV